MLTVEQQQRYPQLVEAIAEAGEVPQSPRFIEFMFGDPETPHVSFKDGNLHRLNVPQDIDTNCKTVWFDDELAYAEVDGAEQFNRLGNIELPSLGGLI